MSDDKSLGATCCGQLDLTAPAGFPRGGGGWWRGWYDWWCWWWDSLFLCQSPEIWTESFFDGFPYRKWYTCLYTNI